MHFSFKCNIVIFIMFFIVLGTVSETPSDSCSSKSESSCSSNRKKSVISNESKNVLDLANTNTTKGMIKIVGGQFNMGTNKPIFVADGEGPQRSVIIDDFYIDIHEVSNEEFSLFVNDTAYITEVCTNVAC